jgi:4-hydroxyphenylacetate 3-monooxygenase
VQSFYGRTGLRSENRWKGWGTRSSSPTRTSPRCTPLARSPDTRADVERYYQSSSTSARDRIKLLKLVWDLVGTEYGRRQLQYEMFYSAAQPVVNRRVFGAYDWASAAALVDRLLAEY